MSAVVFLQGSRDYNAGEASTESEARRIAAARGFVVVSVTRSNRFRNSHGPNAWVVRIKANREGVAMVRSKKTKVSAAKPPKSNGFDLW